MFAKVRVAVVGGFLDVVVALTS
jgi:hypothetical protein